MKTQQALVGSRGADSLAFSTGGTGAQASLLKESGIDFFVGYLGNLNAERLSHILDAGLAFMPVTRGGNYDGDSAVKSCRELALSSGCTVWLDLEGKASLDVRPQDLLANIDAWADVISKAGFQPGLYVGSPQPLTGDELFRLHVVRYWKAPARIFDRNGLTWDGPSCGFCMYQLNPSVTWPSDTASDGVFVDVDFVQKDFFGRLPSWVIA